MLIYEFQYISLMNPDALTILNMCLMSSSICINIFALFAIFFTKGAFGNCLLVYVSTLLFWNTVSQLVSVIHDIPSYYAKQSIFSKFILLFFIFFIFATLSKTRCLKF